MRSRRAIKALFAAVIVVIGVQAAVSHKLGEPFPALYFPAFGSSPDNGDTYESDAPVLRVQFADGTTASRPAVDLTERAGVAPQFVLALMASGGLDATGQRLDIEGRSAPVRAVAGQRRALTRDERRAIVDDPAVQGWFRERLRELFPGRPVRTATVSWIRRRVQRETFALVDSTTVKNVVVAGR